LVSRLHLHTFDMAVIVVGKLDGTVVGTDVGVLVGRLDGTPVGADVGTLVGVLVGMMAG
jgi:uncharacterized membrane protein